MKNITIRNCILLPGFDLRPHIQDTMASSARSSRSSNHSPTRTNHKYQTVGFENCILGPDYKLKLSQSDFLEFHKKCNGYLIGTGGSDRQYYRIQHGQDSAVLMECSAQDPDFQRHIEYTGLFRKYDVPVPELIAANPHAMKAVFEDLKDLTLYSWLKCSRDLRAIETMYKKIIDIMVIIHTTVTDHVSECPLLSNRMFDYDHLRWETGYFLERFVNGVKKISIQNVSELEADFHTLAQTVNSFHKTVIHRDFQSQNIMITRESVPRILDYQGARIGPPAYDLVSILWDPYSRLEDDRRTVLLNHYCKKMMHAASWFDETAFRQTLLPCRLQRHMQALGAFGFLALVKGKKHFLRHAPEGLRLLKEALASNNSEYPMIARLVATL